MLFFPQKPLIKTQIVYMNSTWSFGGQNGGKRLQKSAL